MSPAGKDPPGSFFRKKLGPDYFGYYTSEVVELLSRNEVASPFASKLAEVVPSGNVEKDRIENVDGVSGPLFSNVLGNELSDFTKERLKLLLRQGVKVLAPEVDEMIEPVVSMRQLKLRVESKTCGSTIAARDVDAEKPSRPKRLKRSSCSSNSLSALSTRTNPESKNEINDEIKSLIENNSSQVKDAVKKYSNQYYTEAIFWNSFFFPSGNILEHMEQHLEKVLDTVMSKCRLMTISEKHKLGKLIQKLPPENLDRVIEIIRSSNAAYMSSSDEVHVDLEKEPNVTLWRLFTYVKAVENARELAK